MSGRILIQEDDTFLSAQWAKGLTAMGHDVVCVECASDAIMCLRERPFDLCIVDLIILSDRGPVPDGGITLASYIMRSADMTSSRPIVLGVSAHSSEHGDIPAEKLFRGLGADDFLPKPFTTLALLDRVQKLLAKPPRSGPRPQVNDVTR